jgi:DNA-binding MarR family transcriptional regulator
MAETKPSRAAPAPRITIKELLSYRLHRVANAISRGAALHYRRQFNVSLGEWRALALLGAESPQTLNGLAKAAGLDKAQMSRIITGLVDRGYIARDTLPGERRTAQLTLTRKGERIFLGLIDAAAKRNDAFLACLTPEELAALDSALAKLGALARALAAAESGNGRGGG